MNSENNTPTSSNDSDNKPPWLTRREYNNPEEKKRDFWLGFGLWWALNIGLYNCLSFVLTLISSASPTNNAMTATQLIIIMAPLLINLGLMIYLAFMRKQMALGMLAAFGTALALIICLGLFLTALCFGMANSL